MRSVFLSQDLENQALTEAETWREQQVQFEEQQALQNRAKQEVEAEVERYKHVRRSDDFLSSCKLSSASCVVTFMFFS